MVVVVLVTAIGAVVVARHAAYLGVAVIAAALLFLAYGSLVGLRHNWRRNDEWPYNLIFLLISLVGLASLVWRQSV